MAGQWFVVQTKRACESDASDRIAAQGFETFLPLLTTVRRRSRKTGPLFPRYIFVFFNPNEEWAPIKNTRGVSRILCTNDDEPRPAPVPARVMDALRARGQVIVENHDVRLDFAPRTRLRVTDGPFLGFEGLFIEAAHERVRLLLDILGGKVPVWLPDSAITAAV